jgi:hypothetical protein
LRKYGILALVAVAVAILGGIYFGSPYWAARNLALAVKQGDAAQIDALTDMPALRESVKAQVLAAVTHRIRPDRRELGAIVELVAPAVVDKAVDSYVSPEEIVSIVKSGRLEPYDDGSVPPVKAQTAWLDRDHFRVTVQSGTGLVFERRGFAAWKLVRIELPPGLLGG